MLTRLKAKLRSFTLMTAWDEFRYRVLSNQIVSQRKKPVFYRSSNAIN